MLFCCINSPGDRTAVIIESIASSGWEILHRGIPVLPVKKPCTNNLPKWMCPANVHDYRVSGDKGFRICRGDNYSSREGYPGGSTVCRLV